MIELRQVTKTFGPKPGRANPVRALEEVTLRVPEGSTWALVGPNGAGKTTLLALILGFLHPTTGEVHLGGLRPRTYLRRYGAAFLPERFQLPAEWSAITALLALARLEGYRGREARKRAESAIERFGLGPHATRPIVSLSRGLIQRVGLAQVALARHELVILDEPTEGLDPIWRIQFRELITEFRREGRTTLIASHDLAEIERITERAILLDGGKVHELIDIEREGGETRYRYRIDLTGPAPEIFEIFPNATLIDQTPNPTDIASYLVTVTDNEELSTRLAALLTGGAILTAVAPITEQLEERVQRALSGGRP